MSSIDDKKLLSNDDNNAENRMQYLSIEVFSTFGLSPLMFWLQIIKNVAAHS